VSPTEEILGLGQLMDSVSQGEEKLLATRSPTVLFPSTAILRGHFLFRGRCIRADLHRSTPSKHERAGPKEKLLFTFLTSRSPDQVFHKSLEYSSYWATVPLQAEWKETKEWASSSLSSD
jgi:hypothetical protein